MTKLLNITRPTARHRLQHAVSYEQRVADISRRLCVSAAVNYEQRVGDISRRLCVSAAVSI